MRRDEIIEKLQKFDLNLYESRAYFALVSFGSMSSKKLSQVTQIPRPRTYDVLQSLSEKGFAILQPGKEKRYRATDPKGIFKAHIQNLKWDLGKRLEKKKEKLEEVLENFKEKEKNRIRLLEKEYKKLVKELEPYYNKNVKLVEELFEVVKGRGNVTATLSELIKNSKKEILSIIIPPHLPVALPWEAIKSALKRGVEYRRISNTGILFLWGTARMRKDLAKGVSIRLLPLNKIREKFYIFDNEAVFLRTKDEISGFVYTSLVLRFPDVVSLFNSKFEEMWETAKPAETVLKNLEEKIEEVAKKLDTKERLVFTKIVERGRYATFEDLKITSNQLKEIINSLVEKKLLTTLDTGEKIANIDYLCKF